MEKVLILVVSDNHGNRKVLDEVLSLYLHADLKIHCGDHLLDLEYMKNNFNYFVSGNNDFDPTNITKLINLKDYKIFVTHGDREGFSQQNIINNLKKYMTKNDINLALFGHLHIPIYEKFENKQIICPGALANPRSIEGLTYCIIELIFDEQKKIRTNVKFFNL